MAHVTCSVGNSGPSSVIITITTIPQAYHVPSPVPMFKTVGCMASVALPVPTAAHTSQCCTQGHYSGFRAASLATGGTCAQRTAASDAPTTTLMTAPIKNDHMVFNSWNECFSCGSDVSVWHTS
jgi:hypothetical protein